MEFLFSQIKKMDVVSVTDGKNLGRICDVAFFFPENKIKGFFVTGCKGFRLTRSDAFIPVADVVKIGEDVVLVKTGEKSKPSKGGRPDRCPTGCIPDPCAPKRPPDRCPTGCIPDPCAPRCPPPDPRRSYDDYE